jgi:putative ABC transport system substrate-binding protein
MKAFEASIGSVPANGLMAPHETRSKAIAGVVRPMPALPVNAMALRRKLSAFVAACAAAPLFAAAQPAAKIPRIALVQANVSLADMQGSDPADGLTQEFLQRLRQLGYVEGRSISIERRSAEGQPERLPSLMKEVVDLGVNVIVTLGSAVRVARGATSTIPIVGLLDDPVAAGVTATLARPNQNVTGVTFTSGVAMIGKSLQLLKQAAPRSRRVAVFDFKYVDANATPFAHQRRMAAEAAARELGLTLVAVGVNSADDLDEAFAVIDREGADAMMDITSTVTYAHRHRIIDFAARRRLPAIYVCRPCVEQGGLMSYESSSDGAQRMAEYVDKLLRGAKPADLPFEQPSKYQLVINLKTATQLGLAIPQSLLLAAEVID